MLVFIYIFLVCGGNFSLSRKHKKYTCRFILPLLHNFYVRMNVEIYVHINLEFFFTRLHTIIWWRKNRHYGHVYNFFRFFMNELGHPDGCVLSAGMFIITVRQKIFDGKPRHFLPLLIQNFSIPEISETLKDSPTKFFGTVRQKIFDGKSRYFLPPLI